MDREEIKENWRIKANSLTWLRGIRSRYCVVDPAGPTAYERICVLYGRFRQPTTKLPTDVEPSSAIMATHAAPYKRALFIVVLLLSIFLNTTLFFKLPKTIWEEIYRLSLIQLEQPVKITHREENSGSLSLLLVDRQTYYDARGIYYQHNRLVCSVSESQVLNFSTALVLIAGMRYEN
ncbi:hypothetical protein MMC30_000234 [Trapelia coarctata]|nr:hypothetical protein [Trapelia coarctata]